MELDSIRKKIYNIRGQQVMLDRDLAFLYNVSTKRLNEQVKRNIERFPESFMFQLTNSESNRLRSQFATLETGRGKHEKYLPYVFTEQGVAMLSAVLRSETAIKMSIKIIEAFVSMRKFLLENNSLFSRVDLLEIKQIEHDDKINNLLEVIAKPNQIPNQGVFFEGQIWDAYVLINKILKTAKKDVVLFDNYIDEDVLTLFSKYNFSVTIYTKNITKQLKLDVKKYNKQYKEPKQIKIKHFDKAHDRFLIIDNKNIYHIGASLKDLGKKIFAFTKLSKDMMIELEKVI